MTGSTAKVAVLASGSGTNLQALIDACGTSQLSAHIVAVVTDNPDAGAIARAHAAHIPTIVVSRQKDETRSDYDLRLAQAVRDTRADVVVLAGFMRLLSMNFLAHFPMRVINLHPALPGEFPGVHAIERAFAERDVKGRTHSGVMVHFVPDEGVDNGPVIASRQVPILKSDTLDTFTQRMHETEHELIVLAVQKVIQSDLHHLMYPEELTP
jgi:formyltetrahydrofolate-dependent phosphoribosylglycinamide formyltransferase